MTEHVPLVSIIIPTYNRPDELAQCLSAIARLDYPSYEVIVVDDGGRVDLDAVLTDYNVSLLQQENSGAGVARNTGLAVARGAYVAFVDDDTQPHVDWLRLLMDVILEHPDVMVGGYTQNLLTDNVYATASQLIIDMSYEHYSTDDSASFFTSNNMLMATEAVRELGGFDPTMRCSEDRDLCLRWIQSGRGLVYVPEAIVGHQHDLTLWGFMQQHWCYGGGAYQYRVRRARLLRASDDKVSVRVEYGLILNIWGWLSYPTRRLDGWRVIVVTLLFCLWQVVNLMGFLWMAWRERRQSDG